MGPNVKILMGQSFGSWTHEHGRSRVVDEKEDPVEEDKPEEEKAKTSRDVKRHAEKIAKAEQRRLAKEAMEEQRRLRELEAAAS